ncbi:hypothetical protein CPC08DRAFT_651632, partial [Agrocybe pediades]
ASSEEPEPPSPMSENQPPQQTAAPAATMPAKNHSSAPKFDGKAANLQVFLDEVEALAKACKLSAKETIEWAIRYGPLDSYELWSSRPTAKGNDWGAFKNELYPFYLGSAGEWRYSVANLETFVEKQAMILITNGEQFSAYYRTFTTMTDYLLGKGKLRNPPPNTTNTYRPNSQPRQRTNDCAFCSDPNHYQNNCPKATKYIQKGLCTRNNENFIVLPNGLRVSPRIAPGRNIMERIDNWNRSNPPSNIQTVSSNFVGAEYVVPTAGTRSAAAAKPVAPTVVKPKPQDSTSSKPTPNTASAPQYKYSTPIEDAKLINNVLNRALDVPITLTNRELLALAPDVRKQVKELITTKRTPTNGNPLVLAHVDSQETDPVEVFMAGLPDREDGVITAKHTEELRSIDVVIEGITVEGVCDTGSQIVCLRKDVWEKISIPVRSDHVMLIESANESTNSTLGLLHNLKIVIGGYDFFVQAQVVEHAPYEMLLGLPLLTYTESALKLFKDGSMHVTFTDPNTGIVVTTPTRPRTRKNTSKGKARTAGF